MLDEDLECLSESCAQNRTIRTAMSLRCAFSLIGFWEVLVGCDHARGAQRQCASSLPSRKALAVMLAPMMLPLCAASKLCNAPCVQG
eukprot:4784230-Amphidinium_carterae.2